MLQRRVDSPPGGVIILPIPTRNSYGMEQQEIYRSTLGYALAIAGTELALSVRLKVPLGTLQNWLQGLCEIPTAGFLDAVDVITTAKPADISRCRDAMRHTDRRNE